MTSFLSRAGLIGKKLGMTNMIIDNKMIPVTVIQIIDNYVINQKVLENHAVITLGAQNGKKVKMPQAKELEKSNVPPCSVIREFKVSKDEVLNDDQKILSTDYVQDWEFIDVTGNSIGKGFAGCMKKWNFKGGNASHGASLSHRAMGSTGVRDKGWKGKKMAGRMGNTRITVQSLKVVNVDHELKVISVLGAVPGKTNNLLSIKKAIKKFNVKKLIKKVGEK